MAVQRDAAGRAATAALLRAQIAVHEEARDVAQAEVDRQSALIGELEQALTDLDLEAPEPELEPEPDEPEPDPETDPEPESLIRKVRK